MLISMGTDCAPKGILDIFNLRYGNPEPPTLFFDWLVSGTDSFEKVLQPEAQVTLDDLQVTSEIFGDMLIVDIPRFNCKSYHDIPVGYCQEHLLNLVETLNRRRLRMIQVLESTEVSLIRYSWETVSELNHLISFLNSRFPKVRHKILQLTDHEFIGDQFWAVNLEDYRCLNIPRLWNLRHYDTNRIIQLFLELFPE